MNLFRHVTEKPWLTPGPHPWAASEGSGDDIKTTAAVGLKLYFAVATVMFGLILAGYLMRGNAMGMEHEMARDWRPVPKTWLLWYNTGILILSSVAWHWARAAARQNDGEKLHITLILAGALGVVFLSGQLAVWWQLQAGGYFMTANPAVAFFCVVIALHGLHLLGGLFVWGKTAARLLGRTEPAALTLSVDLCALYWHFLLAVWLVMFGFVLLG